MQRGCTSQLGKLASGRCSWAGHGSASDETHLHRCRPNSRRMRGCSSMKASCAPHPLAAERARAAERQLERRWPFLGDDDNWRYYWRGKFVDGFMQMVAYSHTRINAETFMCSMGPEARIYARRPESDDTHHRVEQTSRGFHRVQCIRLDTAMDMHRGSNRAPHMPPLSCRHVLICHSAPLTLHSCLHRGHDGIAEHARRDGLGAGRRNVAREDAAEDGLIHRGFDGGGRRLLTKRIAQHHRAA